jgi:TM2 domain-containing membrane protein YozV
MSQPSPGEPAGLISPDGHWRWDGRQWMPNSSGPLPQPVPSVYMVPTGQTGAMMIAPKNPAISLLVSFFVPGVGSMINGDTGTGVVILALYLVGILASVILIGIPIFIGAWIWGLIDAYQGAQRWNAAHGIIS